MSLVIFRLVSESRQKSAAKRVTRVIAACAFVVLILVSPASAQFLRVVTYNIDADTGGAPGEMGGVYSGPGLTTVLQAIGNAKLAGHAQPIDVLALQELNYSQTSTTLGFIVSQLNNIYGAGAYAYDTTFDPTTGDFTGNGPNGLVYNTRTVQVLGATPVGSASGSGAPRAPMRYKLAPKGYNDHSADFWLYVSHMKAGIAASDGARRNTEATTIRNNAATLGSSAHIIYAGDFNFFAGSSETAYQTFISSSLNAGVGQAVDTLNPANDWTASPAYMSLLTESADFLVDRLDFQLVTNPMLSQPGMQLVPNTLSAFGNGGEIFLTSVTSFSNSAALVDLGQAPYTPAYRDSVLSALTTATNHLPVVADYSFSTAVPEPAAWMLMLIGCLACLRRGKRGWVH
jgi:hypothetical protein